MLGQEEQPAEQQPMANPEGEMSEEELDLSQEQLKQFKELFQEGYSMVYADGDFDVMVEHIEGSNDVVAPLSLLLSGVVSTLIQKHKLTDIQVVFTTAISLMTDIADSLQQANIIELDEQQISEIISKSIENVLNDNPEFAEIVTSDPAVQQSLEDLKAGKPPSEALAQAGQDTVAQPNISGVMGEA